MKYLLTILLGIGIAVGLGSYFKTDGVVGSSVATTKCSVSSTEVATVGDDISSTVLSASETRAYARIQFLNPSNTNTVTLSFDEGAAAVANQGVSLASSTAETVIEFGRATSFPYTGAVTGITDISTTTVLVTECNY